MDIIDLDAVPQSSPKKRRHEEFQLFPIVIDLEAPAPKKIAREVISLVGSTENPISRVGEIKRKLADKHDTCELGLMKKLNTMLTAKEIKTILPPNWICDEVLNSYLAILSQEFLHVYSMTSYWSTQLGQKGAESIETWPATDELKAAINFETKSLVLFPVNISNRHWVLCCMKPKERRWCILDSAGDLKAIESSSFFQEMSMWIRFFLHCGEEEGSKWVFEFPINSENKHQNFNNDSYNCGAYCCYYARELSTAMTIEEVSTKNTPTRKEISRFRDDLLECLVEKIPLNL